MFITLLTEENIYQLLKVNIKIGNENFKLENGNIISDAKVLKKKKTMSFPLVLPNFTFRQNPYGIIRKENNKIVLPPITEENGLMKPIIM